MSKTINLTLKVWRQKNSTSKGQFETYAAPNVDVDSSFLEMLDVVNEGLSKSGKDPIAFDHDCREGICGMCGAVVNGQAHGPQRKTTLCQLHMRQFKDGDTIVLEPYRSRALPVIKDLVVDRSAFDRVQQAGGFISVKTGQAGEANAILVPKVQSDLAMDAAQCIGCAACVAACPNASAMLFVSAKVSHFALLPQGQPERKMRVQRMVAQMDKEGFGNCSNEYECEAACPKGISVSNIARMNRDYLGASIV
ncbi:succinate dehydrogenase/fumarate reductase iron-sulfur subunit [bacterium]|nr:succinate dehydrogenase/fumarate reductase iron-sulfur subunit [bacterium]